jgi:hypothetical protein
MSLHHQRIARAPMAAACLVLTLCAWPAGAQSPSPADVAAKFTGTWKLNKELSPNLSAPPGGPPGAGDLSGPQLRRTLALVTVGWMFGSVWLTATSGAPLTLFARGLRASEFEFGLLSALPFIASLISLPASLDIDRTGARKKAFLWGLYLQRFMWFPIALAPVLIVQRFGIAAAGTAMLLGVSAYASASDQRASVSCNASRPPVIVSGAAAKESRSQPAPAGP